MSPCYPAIATKFQIAGTFLVIGCLLGCQASQEPVADAEKVTEKARIERLITAIEGLDGAEFVRNGTKHSASDAANHLRRKWRNSGGRIQTADQFIDYLATKSSITGQEYTIRLPDGRVVKSADFLRQFLAEM